MDLHYAPKHETCDYYIPDYNIGFKISAPKAGEIYVGKKHAHHSIVFLTEGEVEFSYNEFVNRRFVPGDMFFIPQAAEMYGKAITDCRMIVLTFDNRMTSPCDNCSLPQGMDLIDEIKYDFRPLPTPPMMKNFVETITEYIKGNIKCGYLHEIKQKELFVLMKHHYTLRELVEFFYPILGGSIDFKTRVLESYHEKITVNELASSFGMCYSTFSRKFKNAFGVTAQEWMLKQKAKHIRLRLTMPDVTISEIIRSFGFVDAPHFSRYCKEYFGCTPSELIKQLRNKNSEK